MVCRGSRGHATNGEPPEILIGDVVMHFGPMEPPRFQQVTTEYERRKWAKPHDELQAVLRPVWRRVDSLPAPGAAPAYAGLVEVVREYRNALASYTDGRNDLVECDERTRKAHDALLAFPLPTPGGHPGAAALPEGQ